MKLYGKHLRKSELKQIAEAIGAELVLLKGGDKKKGTKTFQWMIERAQAAYCSDT